jgi:hypothetical protein
MSRTTMNRRRFLRSVVGGAAATVALPPLEAMMDSTGLAWADGEPLPTRFGVWFWGNGIRREHWIPDATGRGWRAKAELQPLEGVRDWFNVVTGYEIKTATHPHHSGMTGIMTGAHYEQVGTTRDTIVSTFAHPSVDQVAAEHLGGETPFRSLEVAVGRFRGTDEGTTFQHLSHNGPNNVNPSEYSARAVYARLFGTTRQDAARVGARVSVLDAVTSHIRKLQGKVGASDRRRLEQHFESVRQLERRLDAEAPSCDPTEMPSDNADIEGREQLEAKNRAMSELVALSMACDLTRVFSVMFSSAGSGVVIWQAGASNGLHQICHDEPAPQPIVHAAITFTMERLAEFLTTLRDTPEGDTNLLDRCSILCTTELSEGNTHSNDEFPILIAGKGGGRLNTGLHVRSRRKANASHAVLQSLLGAGVPVAEFGYDNGRVTEGIGELQA